MRTLVVAIAMSVVCTAALAQTTTRTERYENGRLTTTDSHGNRTVTTERRDSDGSRTITTTHTPGPSGGASSPPLSKRERDGNWTGYQGSPRDVAWMESCRPSLVTDRHGMQRYVYVKRGCETGDPQ